MSKIPRSIFQGAATIAEVANNKIFNKERLTTDDVRAFLVAQTDITRYFLDNIGQQFMKPLQMEETALQEWDMGDRSKCFFHLLYLVESSRESSLFKTAEAAARCSLALVQEPLVTAGDTTRFHELLSVSDTSLKIAKRKRKQELFYLTYACGVLYNADRFCPEIFDKPGNSEETLQLFKDNLQKLQGSSRKRIN